MAVMNATLSNTSSHDAPWTTRAAFEPSERVTTRRALVTSAPRSIATSKRSLGLNDGRHKEASLDAQHELGAIGTGRISARFDEDSRLRPFGGRGRSQ